MSATQTLGAVFTAQIENFLAGIRKVRSELMGLESITAKINKSFSGMTPGLQQMQTAADNAAVKMTQLKEAMNMLSGPNSVVRQNALKILTAGLTEFSTSNKKAAETVSTVADALDRTRLSFSNYIRDISGINKISEKLKDSPKEQINSITEGMKKWKDELSQLSETAQKLVTLSQKQLSGVLTGTSQSVTEYLAKLKEASPLFQAFATGNQAVQQRVEKLTQSFQNGIITFETYQGSIRSVLSAYEKMQSQQQTLAESQLRLNQARMDITNIQQSVELQKKLTEAQKGQIDTQKALTEAQNKAWAIQEKNLVIQEKIAANITKYYNKQQIAEEALSQARSKSAEAVAKQQAAEEKLHQERTKQAGISQRNAANEEKYTQDIIKAKLLAEKASADLLKAQLAADAASQRVISAQTKSQIQLIKSQTDAAVSANKLNIVNAQLAISNEKLENAIAHANIAQEQQNNKYQMGAKLASVLASAQKQYVDAQSAVVIAQQQHRIEQEKSLIAQTQATNKSREAQLIQQEFWKANAKSLEAEKELRNANADSIKTASAKLQAAREAESAALRKSEIAWNTVRVALDNYNATQNKVANSFNVINELINQANTAQKNLTDSTKKVQEELEKQGNSLLNLLNRIKEYANFVVTSLIVNAIVNSLREAFAEIVNFDQALKNLSAITLTDNFAEIIVSMKEMVVIAKNTKFSLVEISEGMVLTAQAGFNVTQSLEMINAEAILASATLTDLATAADLITTTLISFGKTASEAMQVTDVMANAINLSKLTIEKLRIAFNYIGVSAQQAGVKLEETAASFALFANAGLRASTIGTSFRQIMSELLDPTDKIRTTFELMGVPIDKLNPKVEGFRETLRTIASVLIDTEATLKNHGKYVVDMAKAYDLFGLRGSQGAAIIAKAFATGDYDAMLKMISNVGTAMEMQMRQMEGLGFKLKNLGDTFKVVAVHIGEAGLGGAIRLTVGSLRGMLNLLDAFIQTGAGQFIIQMGLMAAAVKTLTAAITLVMIPAMTALVSSIGSLLVQMAALAANSPVILAALTKVSGVFVALGPQLASFGALITKMPGTFALIAAAVVATGIAIVEFGDRTKKAAEDFSVAATEYGRNVEALNNMQINASELFKTGDIEHYQQTLKAFTQQYPKLVARIKESADVADIATLSFDQLQEAIKKLINTEFENQITANIRAMEKLDEVAQKAVKNYEEYKNAAKDDSPLPFTLPTNWGSQEGEIKKLQEAQKSYKNSVDETVNSLIAYKKRMELSEKGLREYISTLKITPFEAAKVAAAVSAELRKIEEASKIDVGLIKFQSYFQELPMEFRDMYEKMDAVQKTEFLSFQRTLAQKVSEYKASAKQNYITEEEVQKSIAALKANEYAEWMIKNNDRLKATQDTEQATIDILRSFIDKSLSEFRRGNISRMQAEGEVAGYTREINEQYVGGLKKAYESAKSLTEGYVNTLNTRMNDIRSKIASLNKDITESDKSYHEDIRDLRQKTMSDEQKWLDDRAEANRLLQEGMSSQNVDMLKQSQQIFKSLARTVNDENGKAIAGVDDTVKVAQQGVEASHKAAVEAMQRQRAEFTQNMGDIQTQIVNVEARLEMYRKKIEEVSSTPFQLNTTRLEETFTELTGFVGRFKDALKKEEMELNIRFTGEGSDKKLITEKTEEVEKEVSDVIEKLDGKEATVRVAVETDKSAEVPTSSESTVSVKAIVDDSEIRKLPETVESVADIISSPVVSTRFEAFEPGLQPVSFSQKVQNIKNEIAGLSSLLHGAYNIFRVSFIGSPGEKSLAETALNAVNTVRDSSRIINEQTAIFRTAFLSGDDSELSDKAQETIDLFQDTRSRVEGMASVFKTSFIDDSDKPISKGIADLIVQSGYLSNHINKLKTNYQVLISDETGVPVTTKLRDLPGAFAQTAGAIGSVLPVFTTNFLADDGTPLISKLTNVVTSVQRVASLISGISAIFGVNFIGRASSALPLSEKIEEIHKKITGFASVISRTVATFTTRFITGEGSPLSEGIEWIQEKIGRLAHLITNFSPAFILRFVGNVADNLSVSDSVDRIWEKIKGFITFITTSTAVFTTQIMSGNIPFVEYLETAREKLSDFISFISSVTASVTVGISDFYSNLPIADTLDTLKEKFQTFTEFIKNLLPEFVIRFFGEASDSLPLSEKIEEILDKIKNVAEWLTKNVATFTTRFMSDLNLPVDEAVEWVQDKIKGFISFISGLKSLIKIWFISGDDDTNIFSKIFSITKEFKNLGNIISALGPIFKIWFKARGVKEDLKDGVEETKGMFSRLTSFIAGKATDFVVNFIGRGSSAKSLSEKVEEMKDRVTGFGENIADAIPKVNLDFTGIMPAMKAVFDYLIQAVSGMKGSLGGFGDDFLEKIISLKENMTGAFDDINNALQTRAEIVEKGYMSFFDRMLGTIREYAVATKEKTVEIVKAGLEMKQKITGAANIFRVMFVGNDTYNEEPLINKVTKTVNLLRSAGANISKLKNTFKVGFTDLEGKNLSPRATELVNSFKRTSEEINNIYTAFKAVFITDDNIPVGEAIRTIWSEAKKLSVDIMGLNANFNLMFETDNGLPLSVRIHQVMNQSKNLSDFIGNLSTTLTTDFLSNEGLTTTDQLNKTISGFLNLSGILDDLTSVFTINFMGEGSDRKPITEKISEVWGKISGFASSVGKSVAKFVTRFTDGEGKTFTSAVNWVKMQTGWLRKAISDKFATFTIRFQDENGKSLWESVTGLFNKFLGFNKYIKDIKTIFSVSFLTDGGLTFEQKMDFLKQKIGIITNYINGVSAVLKVRFADENGNFSFEKMADAFKAKVREIREYVKNTALNLYFSIAGKDGIDFKDLPKWIIKKLKEVQNFIKGFTGEISFDFVSADGTPLGNFLVWLKDTIVSVIGFISGNAAEFVTNIVSGEGTPIKDALNAAKNGVQNTASTIRGSSALFKIFVGDPDMPLTEKLKLTVGSFQKVKDTINGLKAAFKMAVVADETGVPVPEHLQGIVGACRTVSDTINGIKSKFKVFFTGEGSDEKGLTEKTEESIGLLDKFSGFANGLKTKILTAFTDEDGKPTEEKLPELMGQLGDYANAAKDKTIDVTTRFVDNTGKYIQDVAPGILESFTSLSDQIKNLSTFFNINILGTASEAKPFTEKLKEIWDIITEFVKKIVLLPATLMIHIKYGDEFKYAESKEITEFRQKMGLALKDIGKYKEEIGKFRAEAIDLFKKLNAQKGEVKIDGLKETVISVTDMSGEVINVKKSLDEVPKSVQNIIFQTEKLSDITNKTMFFPDLKGISNFENALRGVLSSTDNYIDPFEQKMIEINEMLKKMGLDTVDYFQLLEDKDGYYTSSKARAYYNELLEGIASYKSHIIHSFEEVASRTDSFSDKASLDYSVRMDGLKDISTTTVHELGHHIMMVAEGARDIAKKTFESAKKENKIATRYMLKDYGEFFAESYALFVAGEKKLIQPDLLKYFEELHKETQPISLNYDVENFNQFIGKMKEVDDLYKKGTAQPFKSVKFDLDVEWLNKIHEKITTAIGIVPVKTEIKTDVQFVSGPKSLSEMYATMNDEHASFIERLKATTALVRIAFTGSDGTDEGVPFSEQLKKLEKNTDIFSTNMSRIKTTLKILFSTKEGESLTEGFLRNMRQTEAFAGNIGNINAVARIGFETEDGGNPLIAMSNLIAAIDKGVIRINNTVSKSKTYFTDGDGKPVGDAIESVKKIVGDASEYITEQSPDWMVNILTDRGGKSYEDRMEDVQFYAQKTRDVLNTFDANFRVNFLSGDDNKPLADKLLQTGYDFRRMSEEIYHLGARYIIAVTGDKGEDILFYLNDKIDIFENFGKKIVGNVFDKIREGSKFLIKDEDVRYSFDGATRLIESWVKKSVMMLSDVGRFLTLGFDIEDSSLDKTGIVLGNLKNKISETFSSISSETQDVKKSVLEFITDFLDRFAFIPMLGKTIIFPFFQTFLNVASAPFKILYFLTEKFLGLFVKIPGISNMFNILTGYVSKFSNVFIGIFSKIPYVNTIFSALAKTFGFVATKLNIVTGAISAFLMGWDIGRIIGDMDLFGLLPMKIDDFVQKGLGYLDLFSQQAIEKISGLLAKFEKIPGFKWLGRFFKDVQEDAKQSVEQINTTIEGINPVSVKADDSEITSSAVKIKKIGEEIVTEFAKPILIKAGIDENFKKQLNDFQNDVKNAQTELIVDFVGIMSPAAPLSEKIKEAKEKITNLSKEINTQDTRMSVSFRDEEGKNIKDEIRETEEYVTVFGQKIKNEDLDLIMKMDTSQVKEGEKDVEQASSIFRVFKTGAIAVGEVLRGITIKGFAGLSKSIGTISAGMGGVKILFKELVGYITPAIAMVGKFSPLLARLLGFMNPISAAVSTFLTAFDFGKIINDMDIFGLLPMKIGDFVQKGMGYIDKFISELVGRFTNVGKTISETLGFDWLASKFSNISDKIKGHVEDVNRTIEYIKPINVVDDKKSEEGIVKLKRKTEDFFTWLMDGYEKNFNNIPESELVMVAAVRGSTKGLFTEKMEEFRNKIADFKDYLAKGAEFVTGFFGVGSSKKPFTEKADEIEGRTDQLNEKISEGSTHVTKFETDGIEDAVQKSEAIKEQIAKIRSVYRDLFKEDNSNNITQMTGEIYHAYENFYNKLDARRKISFEKFWADTESEVKTYEDAAVKHGISEEQRMADIERIRREAFEKFKQIAAQEIDTTHAESLKKTVSDIAEYTSLMDQESQRRVESMQTELDAIDRYQQEQELLAAKGLENNDTMIQAKADFTESLRKSAGDLGEVSQQEIDTITKANMEKAALFQGMYQIQESVAQKQRKLQVAMIDEEVANLQKKFEFSLSMLDAYEQREIASITKAVGDKKHLNDLEVQHTQSRLSSEEKANLELILEKEKFWKKNLSLQQENIDAANQILSDPKRSEAEKQLAEQTLKSIKERNEEGLKLEKEAVEARKKLGETTVANHKQSNSIQQQADAELLIEKQKFFKKNLEFQKANIEEANKIIADPKRSEAEKKAAEQTLKSIKERNEDIVTLEKDTLNAKIKLQNEEVTAAKAASKEKQRAEQAVNNEVKAINRQTIKERIKLYNDYITGLKAKLNEYRDKEKTVASEILAIQEKINNSRKTAEQLVRDLRRKNMSEEQQYNDKWREVEELRAKAAIAIQTDFEKGNQLYEDAKQLAASLGEEVKNNEQVIVSQYLASERAIKAVTDMQKEQEDALLSSQDSRQAEQDDLREKSEETAEQIQGVSEELKALKEQDKSLKIETNSPEVIAEIEQIQGALDKIKDKTVTVTVVKKESSETAMNEGGRVKYATGGPVFGTPGIDNIPAWLTHNEFVQPVPSVFRYGLDFMEGIRKRIFPVENIKLILAAGTKRLKKIFAQNENKYYNGGYVWKPPFVSVPSVSSIVKNITVNRYSEGGLAKGMTMADLQGFGNFTLSDPNTGAKIKAMAPAIDLQQFGRAVKRDQRLRYNPS